MAKNNNRQQTPRSAAPPARPIVLQKPPAADKPAFGGTLPARTQMAVAAAIAIITWLFLKVCLNNQFTNWDDPGYVINNPYIKDLSGDGLKNIFTNGVMGNYHPLTILTYAIEYSKVALEPWLYHFDSLLLHVITTVLAYWLVSLLTRRPVAAAIAALLFGLHPMHIESIAWIAGRKDVLYGAFYIAGCIAYVYYIRAAAGRRGMLYAGMLALYVCALLAKPVAVVLPVTLLLIDYYERRRLTMAVLVEKALPFALSIAAGIRSIYDQRAFHALGADNVKYNLLQRIPLGCYALITYLWKAVAPSGLCCFYPYPEKVNGTLPGVYYIYLPIALGLVALVAFLIRTKDPKYRPYIFGSLFFLVNIVLLLQFIAVGSAILADRYSYMPYLGLFFMAGWAVSAFFQPGGNRQAGYGLLAAMLVYCAVLGYKANEQCQVWYNTVSLWRDEIEKEPVRAPNAYNNLGFEYFNKFSETSDANEKKIYYDSSYYLLNKSIALQPTFVNSYESLGELLRSVNNFPEAKKNYYKALSFHNTNELHNTYLGLGIVYAITHNFDSADYCFRTAIELHPYFPEAHGNYGNFYDMTGKPDSAIVQYNEAIAQNPDMYAPHLNRGRLLLRMNKPKEALADFNTAIEMKPEFGEMYYWRGQAYLATGNQPAANQDIQKAKALGYKVQ